MQLARRIGVVLTVVFLAGLGLSGVAQAGPVFQPDGAIRRASGPLKGDDIYNSTGAGQTLRFTRAPGQWASAIVDWQNDGNVESSIGYHPKGGNSQFKVKYLNDLGDDFTDLLLSGSTGS